MTAWAHKALCSLCHSTYSKLGKHNPSKQHDVEQGVVATGMEKQGSMQKEEMRK